MNPRTRNALAEVKESAEAVALVVGGIALLCALRPFYVAGNTVKAAVLETVKPNGVGLVRGALAGFYGDPPYCPRPWWYSGTPLSWDRIRPGSLKV